MLKLQNQGGEQTRGRYWIMAAAVLVFLTIVLGNVTRTSGAAEACPDWSTCYGQLALPAEQFARVSMLHQILSAAALVFTLTALWRVLVHESISRWVRLPLAAAAVILLLQTGLGAGMGRKQEVCGAVTGGILVLGLRHGRGARDDHSATELTYLRTRELMQRFSAKHGSCLCRQLLQGYDLATQEGLQRAKADGVINKVCRSCVQTVVEILESMK